MHTGCRWTLRCKLGDEDGTELPPFQQATVTEPSEASSLVHMRQPVVICLCLQQVIRAGLAKGPSNSHFQLRLAVW